MLFFRLGEGCTHVAALLFFLEANESVPSTSKPCEWNKPSKKKRDYEPVNQMKFKKFKYGKSDDMNNNENKENSGVHVDNISFFQTLCGKLGNNPLPTSADPVIYSLYDTNYINTNVPVENDLNVSECEDVVTCEDNIPNIYKFIYLEPENFDSSDEFFHFVKDIPHENISEIEIMTRGQFSNERWKACRNMRITASNFHDVVTRQETTTSDKLANKFIRASYEINNFDVPSLAWGRKHEPIAKKKYSALQRLQKKKTKMDDVGLFLCPNYGYLGASPDGIVIEDMNKTLIEVKCPYKWRNCTVLEACESKDFYCVCKNDEIVLKSTHRYYTQIQGQMFVTGIHSCQLLIYTLKDLVVITINYDENFCAEMVSKLECFYKKNVLPLIFSD